jgi:hypothetical protein
MTAAQINHFLVIYDIPHGLAHVDAYGRDYARALEAYAEAEEKYRRNHDVEVVLLGSDSIETLARTHASYFELAENHVDRLVARELAELGLN